MITRLVAVLCSLSLSLRHVAKLNIRRGERLRYFLKSANLALCYAGFRDSALIGQAVQAGRAAFLCCAYDVVTDWRKFDAAAFEVFQQILAQTTSLDLAELALSLYHKERDGNLQEDGLERGAVALEFVTRMMGCGGRFRESAFLKSTGRLLQLVDDLLDYEEDLRTGDLNCLDSPRREVYLTQAEELASQSFLDTLSCDSILAHVVEVAVTKARLLRSLDRQATTL